MKNLYAHFRLAVV